MSTTAIYFILFHITVRIFAINPIVETNVGQIRGLQSSDGGYYMFMGIPYADVDETNPFGASRPHPEFGDVFDAYDDSAICPQREQFNNTITGTLDCLHLNIYVPNSNNNTNKLSVMIYIYGGNFIRGFASKFIIGPKYLVRHDVIVVTFNYRVGLYGFMCLNTPEVPGNQGLKDQLLALRWVKNNIRAFGGDEDKITLFGNSAGGRSAELQLLNNKENENLFRSIIVQSGSAFSSQSIVYSNATIPMLVCEQLGFPTNDIGEAISFLSTVHTNSVVQATQRLNFNFGPCVEKQFPNVEAFMLEYPINLKSIGKYNGVLVMTGFNSHEFLSITLQSSSAIRSSDPFSVELRDRFNFVDDKFSKIEYLVRRFYIGDEEIDSPAIWGLVDFRSDIMYNYPAARSIGRYIMNGVDKVFYYLFSYDGGRNYSKRRYNITEDGANHSDEIGYLFDMELMPETPMPDDQLTIDRMTIMWTNFAKYGDPTPQTSSLLTVKWEPIINGSVYHYLNIDSELSAGKRPFHQRMAFWDLFYDTYAKYERDALTSSASSFVLYQPLMLSYLFIIILQIRI